MLWRLALVGAVEWRSQLGQLGLQPARRYPRNGRGLRTERRVAGTCPKRSRSQLGKRHLKIGGEQHGEKEEKDADKNYYRRERSFGRFERSFRLPDGIQSEKVEARYNNGVLNVSVPKSEAAKNSVRRVEVKVR